MRYTDINIPLHQSMEMYRTPFVDKNKFFDEMPLAVYSEARVIDSSILTNKHDNPYRGIQNFIKGTQEGCQILVNDTQTAPRVDDYDYVSEASVIFFY